MSNKEKSKSKTPMKDLLDKHGIKRYAGDNPFYRPGATIIQLNPIIFKESSEDEKGEDENE